MKIAAIQTSSQATITRKEDNSKNLPFKSMKLGILGAMGAFMQGIENRGYFASFLIQDGLGMTFPRVATGFHRDKEVTGKYNFKEGIEVLLREGLTGPFLISVAPVMLAITGKFCKSSNTNTRLIKIIGNNFKEMLKKPEFNQALKSDKSAFEKEFFKYNLEKFYTTTNPADKDSSVLINQVMKEFSDFGSDNKKVREKAYKNMLNAINERIIKTSSNLDEICRLSANVDGKVKTFASGDVIKAIKDFGHDAIYKNADSALINEASAENIKNNLAAKRLGFNIASIAATLTGLSILPKIYARNKVAPGAMHLVEQKEQENNNNPSFKGKGINSENIISKIGKLITQRVPEWFQREFEYNGYNFSPSLMACLSLFGLLLPRGLKAYNRAYIDENGNRDWSEVKEILLRDSVSSLAVVYTVPILTKCIVSAYEDHKGFILTNKASQNKDSWHKFLDIINPYSDLKVLTNTEIQSLYGNIDSKEKMLNFAEYIDKKGGNLAKILSESKNASEVFNERTFTLESQKGINKKEANEKIINFIKELKGGNETNKIIQRLMKDSGNIKQSTITKLARGLNSFPGFLVTVFISPIILGCFIPLLTYSNTRKAHAKMLAESDASKKIYA